MLGHLGTSSSSTLFRRCRCCCCRCCCCSRARYFLVVAFSSSPASCALCAILCDELTDCLPACQANVVVVTMTQQQQQQRTPQQQQRRCANFALKHFCRSLRLRCCCSAHTAVAAAAVAAFADCIAPLCCVIYLFSVHQLIFWPQKRCICPIARQF